MNDESPKIKSRFPKKTLIWTILAAILVAVLLTQSYYFNEKYDIDPALLSLSSLLITVITILAWSFWAFFLAKLRLVGLFIFLIPFGFVVLFQLNFDGDMRISGVVPRFWSRNVDFVETPKFGDQASATDVDLKTTTPDDFPQFLGPNRNAQLDGIDLADSWSQPPQELWKIGIGEGWSGFAAVNGYAITQEQRGAEECVTCYNIETGDLAWKHAVNRRHEDQMAMGKVGPRATPTIDEGLVYTMGGTGVLDCLDGSTGQPIWSVDVPSLVSIEKLPKKNSLGLDYTIEDSTLAWGRSGSPLIVGDKVILPAGGPAENKKGAVTVTMIAFNKKTGKEIWRGGNRTISYGSPTIATIGGKKQILLVTETDAVGHDLETGEELWSHQWLGFSNAAANCSQVTVIDDTHVLLSKGYNQGGELISVTQDPNGQWATESIKKDPRLLKTKFTNPVIYEGHAYSLSDGFLECTEVATDGDTFDRKWKQRGRFGHGQLLLVGDKLLVHSESGTLFLIKADPAGYAELAKAETIKGICWNTICLYGDLVLVRSEVQAACYRLPLAGTSNQIDNAKRDGGLQPQ